MKSTKVGVVILICLVGILVIPMTLHGSLRKSEEQLRIELLTEKPLGSSLADVKQWLSVKKKLDPKVVPTGFLRQQQPGTNVIGVQSISVNLGEYKSLPLLTTTVMAYWGFDKDGRLIDVWVWKTRDGI